NASRPTTDATPTKTRPEMIIGLMGRNLSKAVVSRQQAVGKKDLLGGRGTTAGSFPTAYCLLLTAFRSSVTQQHSLLEQVARQLDAGRLQAVDEGGPTPRRLELAVGPPVLVDAQLLVTEDLLHDDHVLLHAHHLRDARHLSRPALQAVGLDDHVDGRTDLLTH